MLKAINSRVLPILFKRQGVRSYFQFITNRERNLRSWTKNTILMEWIDKQIKLCDPDRIHLCDGSEEENQLLISNMVQSGTLLPLNQQLRPGCYLARSDKRDVARVEERTFICSESESDSGPLNNWSDPEVMENKLHNLFQGSMRGRTMFVVPFSMGPVASPLSHIGVQITDSPYAVVNMRIMTRIGTSVLNLLNEHQEFVPCMHSVGYPLEKSQEDVAWPCNPEKYIVHFPEQRRIASFGSGYGGNALLGKKCFALRIASVLARDQGWLAEHMLIVGVTNPQGVKKYFCAAFPSACGKTNLAMMEPKLPGWKVECVGDDICWMKFGSDGRLWAINPEAGFFGVAPGTSFETNPNCMKTIEKNTIFTNVAMTKDGDVWWEGMTKEAPNTLKSWLRREWYPDCGEEAAHPNSRFTTPASQCPVIDPEWESQSGVPISGIIFGGRRSNTVPLVFESFNWRHGTFVGSTMNSETTAAATGKRGVLRSDPFAMKPFCGYHIGDYFNHWLNIGTKTTPSKLPKIYHVNWFRKSDQGRFLWPGYGENSRVLKWIFERTEENPTTASIHTPIGVIPDYKKGGLDLSGLKISQPELDHLFKIDREEWLTEATRCKEFYRDIGTKIPKGLHEELSELNRRLEGNNN
jgi:phosphoenolpyruvate carboxykinase (GTP)